MWIKYTISEDGLNCLVLMYILTDIMKEQKQKKNVCKVIQSFSIQPGTFNFLFNN